VNEKRTAACLGGFLFLRLIKRGDLKETLTSTKGVLPGGEGTDLKKERVGREKEGHSLDPKEKG